MIRANLSTVYPFYNRDSFYLQVRLRSFGVVFNVKIINIIFGKSYL